MKLVGETTDAEDGIVAAAAVGVEETGALGECVAEGAGVADGALADPGVVVAVVVGIGTGVGSAALAGAATPTPVSAITMIDAQMPVITTFRDVAKGKIVIGRVLQMLGRAHRRSP